MAGLYTQNKFPLPGSRSIFVCPSLTNTAAGFSNPPNSGNPWFAYAMNRMMNGLSGKLYQRSIAALPAQVILFSESENNNFSFTDGYFLGPNNFPVVPPRHSGGMNFVFVDGHAEWFLLADYGRPSQMGTGTGAQFEWAQSHKVYWFPCRTCNKS